MIPCPKGGAGGAGSCCWLLLGFWSIFGGSVASLPSACPSCGTEHQGRVSQKNLIRAAKPFQAPSRLGVGVCIALQCIPEADVKALCKYWLIKALLRDTAEGLVLRDVQTLSPRAEVTFPKSCSSF